MFKHPQSPMAGSANAKPVSSNVAHYLAAASLPNIRLAPSTPPMPPEGHKSHINFLAIQPERYRKLRRMHRLMPRFVDKNTLDFIRNHIPDKPINVEDVDSETGEQPSIPCEGYEVTEYTSPPVRNLTEIGVSWLSTTVLRTVQRILQMIPEFEKVFKGYSFTLPDLIRDDDSALFRYFLWEKILDPGSDEEESPVKMIVAYQPPWILSPRDMEQFASTRTRVLPSVEACMLEGLQYNSACKVWAKLWDVCKQNRCHSFVLTNYSQWCFGGFSPAWENGYTTSVKHAAPVTKVPSKVNTFNNMAMNARVPPSRGRPSRPIRAGSARAHTAAKKAAEAALLKSKAKKPLDNGPSVLEYLTYWSYSAVESSGSFRHPPVLEGVTLSSDQSVDDDSERSTPGAVTPTQAYHSQPFIRDILPSESSWGSHMSYGAGPSSGVHLTRGSNEIPSSLNSLYEVPKLPERSDAKRPRNIPSWLNTMSTSPPDYLTPSPIPTPPSPTRSEWSELSFAALRPDRAQGFFNRQTTIKEEYEGDGMAMDVE